MLDRGGQCRRVVYTPGQSTWAAMRYTGEYQIRRSREEELTIELGLAGWAWSPGGRYGRFQCMAPAAMCGCRRAALRYWLSKVALAGRSSAWQDSSRL